MKLLHTSDWHLGMGYRNLFSYAEDQKFAIEEICKIALENKVDAILLAGDVFDKSIASQEAIRLYDELMTYVCGELGLPVYMVAGNHDGAERLSQCNRLLVKSGLHIAGSLEKEPQVYTVGDVDIYLLPWISTDKVRAVYPEKVDEINSMEDAYRVVLESYKSSFVPGHKNILVGHAFIVNAVTSISDRAACVGNATAVGSYLFEGFDYVALGHLHGPQSIGANIRYSGTPMAYSFGDEEKQKKSVTIIDTDTLERLEIPVPSLHTRTTLAGTFDELYEANYPEEIVNGFVRLEVSDSYIGLEAMAQLGSKYPRLLEVSGNSMEHNDAKITMTMEDFEQAKDNPETVFCKYCEDILDEAPTEHRLDMFRRALAAYEKEGAAE